LRGLGRSASMAGTFTSARSASVNVREWPPSERQRERLFGVGAGSLSDAELLAVVLGSGVRGQDVLLLARELIAQWGGLATLLASSPRALARARGLGPARLGRLLAAVEPGRRYLEAPREPRGTLTAPTDAARFF